MSFSHIYHLLTLVPSAVMDRGFFTYQHQSSVWTKIQSSSYCYTHRTNPTQHTIPSFQLGLHVCFPDTWWDVPVFQHSAQAQEAVQILVLQHTISTVPHKCLPAFELPVKRTPLDSMTYFCFAFQHSKCKVVPMQATETYQGSGSIAAAVLNLNTTWKK